MLKSVLIKNFALIDKLELEFSKGLNIITGETGAGKSIIIDALMMAAGERASPDYVRRGEKKSIIECTFEAPENHPVYKLLRDGDLDNFGLEIIARREISAKGSSRCFINDTPVALADLKKFGALLVDFHGQHGHQMLLSKESHIEILDILAKNFHLIEKYKKELGILKHLTSDFLSILKKEKSLRQKEEYIKFELEEIEKIGPKENEEEEIEKELKKLENAETLFLLSSEISGRLYENDNSIHDSLSVIKEKIDKLAEIDPSFQIFIKECNAAIISLDEIAKFAGDYSQNIDYGQEKIEELRRRAGELRTLRKKYGSYEGLFLRWNELKREISLIENFEGELKKLQSKITGSQKTLGDIAAELTESRKIAANTAEKSIKENLKTLGIENSSFKAEFRQQLINTPEIADIAATVKNKSYKAYENGIEQIEFYISTNKGEEPKPLAQTASGGEISRIMLALKTIVAESDKLPMLVFDEIDSGISGRIARKTGIAMKRLSERHQVISITHLPQIAALGDLNISVGKEETGGRTIVSAKILNEKEKLSEIAKLLGGEKITESALESAKELAKN